MVIVNDVWSSSWLFCFVKWQNIKCMQFVSLLALKMKYKFVEDSCSLSVQFCAVDVVDETELPRFSPAQNASPPESSSENRTSSAHCSRSRRRLKATGAIRDDCSVKDDKQLLIDVGKLADDVIPVGTSRASLKSEHGAGSESQSPDTARDDLEVDEHDQSRKRLGLKLDQSTDDRGQIAAIAADVSHASEEVETIRVSRMVC